MNYLLCTHSRFERAAHAAPLILSDELIELWGEIYLANPLLTQLGITFEDFLSAPAGILSAATYQTLMPLPDGAQFYALLPAQRAVRDRMDAADAGQLELALGVSEKQITPGSPAARDGALFEKLRHHVWPRHAVRRQQKMTGEPTS